MTITGALRVAAAALAVAQAAAGGTGAWRIGVHAPGIVDVAGPRADGRLVLSTKTGLFLLRPGGAPEPFAAGSGYVAGGGEPYLALAPRSGVSGVACSFRRDDVYVLDAGATPGVVRVTASGGTAARIVDFPAGTFPSGIAFDRYGRFGYRLLVTVVVGDATTLDAIDCRGRVTPIVQGGPHVEGGIVVAPPGFGRFGGDVIAADEDTGRVYAFERDGEVALVAQPQLASGPDRGVEALGVVPRAATAAYLSDLGAPGSPTQGDDSLLVLSRRDLARAKVRPGDVLAAAEGGGTTVAIRCAAACTVRPVATAPPETHAEGHIALLTAHA